MMPIETAPETAHTTTPGPFAQCRSFRWPLSVLILAGSLLSPQLGMAGEPSIDLTGKIAVIATFASRDSFANEYRYEVAVRNLGPDVIAGDSLRLVLDRILNVAGEDREPLKDEPLLNRMEILSADGQTEDGKPFFWLTVDGGQDLLPHTESQAVTVRLRNRDYVQVFTPSFRVFGSRRAPRAARLHETLLTTPAMPPPQDGHTVETLVQLLIQKGVLSEAEWRAATKPTP